MRCARSGRRSGLLTKESAPDELVSAIRRLLNGSRYVTPTLGEKLALELGTTAASRCRDASDREYQVMWMIASGKTVRQIADGCSFRRIPAQRTARAFFEK
jgi:DNA-binding NarL/FixJ family response regulator